jgi:hypothetical protein
MAINVDDTKNKLAQTYTGLGKFFGLATTQPGSTAAPNNYETSGPDYARVAANWIQNPSDPGVFTGSCIVTADAGTYAFAILCQGSTAGAADMIDNCSIVSTILSGTGQITLSTSYTQT